MIELKGMNERMKVGFVSLGCSKNLVDTEMAIGLFKKNNYEIVNNPEEAEIIIINTCGFIESAKQEAIETIFEMAKYKEKRCKYLIVMGCLVQRYKEELKKSIPEVDLFIKYDEYKEFWNRIENLVQEDFKTNSSCQQMDFLDRIITTGKNFAYLRVAEGCSNRCTYCAIPYIRGAYVSRTMEDILEEAQKIAKSGIKELIVIAQDTTKYGIDIYGKQKLPELLKELCKIEGIEWVRFLYVYPESITDELIEVVRDNPKICKYFDMPIQHIADQVLKRMNRKTTGEKIKNIISKIRKEIPNVIIRTTVLVGFPGETQEQFDELYNFIKEVKIEKLGAFAYSKEEGTPAEKIDGHLHYKTKQSRYNKVMQLQQEISKKVLLQKVDEEYDVLIEGKTFDGKYYVGRTYMDVPDTDGVVYIKTDIHNLEGKFVRCKIVDVLDYDLVGEIK